MGCIPIHGLMMVERLVAGCPELSLKQSWLWTMHWHPVMMVERLVAGCPELSLKQSWLWRMQWYPGDSEAAGVEAVCKI